MGKYESEITPYSDNFHEVDKDWYTQGFHGSQLRHQNETNEPNCNHRIQDDVPIHSLLVARCMLLVARYS